jgi:hypothetical protein
MTRKPLWLAGMALAASFTMTIGVAQAQSADDTKETTPKSNKPYDKHDITGVWVSKALTGTSLVDDKLRPPMTPWAQKLFDASIPSLGSRDIPGKENDPTLICEPDGVPKILTSPEPFEIANIPGRLLMIFEKDHNIRQVWVDGRKLPKSPDSTYYGTSVGHWDGDTFVVETTGFNEKTWLSYFGDPHSDGMKLTEYYKRIDANTLSIAVTIDDPKAYTKPWVGEPKLFTYQPTWEIHEWYCSPDDQKQYDGSIRVPSGQPDPNSAK